jgi:hypothetical protein
MLFLTRLLFFTKGLLLFVDVVVEVKVDLFENIASLSLILFPVTIPVEGLLTILLSLLYSFEILFYLLFFYHHY